MGIKEWEELYDKGREMFFSKIIEKIPNTEEDMPIQEQESHWTPNKQKDNSTHQITIKAWNIQEREGNILEAASRESWATYQGSIP